MTKFFYHIGMKRARSFVHPITITLSLIIVFVLGPFLSYNINYIGRIYPNIYIAGTNVGGKTIQEATDTLSRTISDPIDIKLVGSDQSFDIITKNIGLNYNLAESVNRSYNLTRTGNLFFDYYLRLKLLIDKHTVGLTTNIDNVALATEINNVSQKIEVSPVYPSIQEVDGAVQINKGSTGTQIDNKLLMALIGKNLSYTDNNPINIPLEVINPTLNEQQIVEAKIRAQKYLGKSISLKLGDQNFDVSESEIFKMIIPSGGYSDRVINEKIDQISLSVNRDPQNAKFEFNGQRVTEFQPALDGLKVDSAKTHDLIISMLDKVSVTENNNLADSLPVIKTPPEITTDQINNLGIKELIGRGTSTYFHSIPGRVFNVNLAASRINGTLVKPGDTFSFNQTLGDVSKFTGYQQAYIISGGHTVLGDGGGVCQVSTTLFRAALNAGLPIVERTAHAYRVGYYEQNSPPGIDATVYGPSPDFKFTNDTPGYILVQAINDSRNYSLVFELYGTSDGRVARITKPTLSNITPPLPTVYQDDPTLPVGTLKQTDFAAGGARAIFDYAIEKNGQQIFQKTFVSNYQPWAAVYMKGTKTN